MYLDVTIRVSEDASQFLGFYTEGEEIGSTREVKFYEDTFKNYSNDGIIITAPLKGPVDNVHPLIGDAKQLKSGDYQGIVSLLEKAVQDKDFIDTVHIRHNNSYDPILWGDLYNSEPEDRIGHEDFACKVRSYHNCSVKNLLSLAKKKLERENAPLSNRLTREFTLAKRKANHLADRLLTGLTGENLASVVSASVIAPVYIARLGYQVGSSVSWKIKSFF